MHTRIKQIRVEAGLNQRKFGDKLGITNAAVTKLENGVNKPSEQTIRAICQEFHVMRNWLEYGIEPMYAPEDEFAIKVHQLIPDASDQVVNFFKALVEVPNGLDTFIEVCKRYNSLEKQKDSCN